MVFQSNRWTEKEGVGDRVSGDRVSENRVSENRLSENRVSENRVSGNRASEDRRASEERRASEDRRASKDRRTSEVVSKPLGRLRPPEVTSRSRDVNKDGGGVNELNTFPIPN